MTKKKKEFYIVAYTQAGVSFKDNIELWDMVFSSVEAAKKSVQDDGEPLDYSYKILKAEVVCETADLPVKVTWKNS